MKYLIGLFLFVMLVVAFNTPAIAEQGRYTERHRMHYGDHLRPLDGIKILIGIDRFGHKIEKYIIPPYTQKPKSRVGVDIQL